MRRCLTEEEITVSFFAGLCLFLSAVEYAIPKPLPFMRIGLANLPILLALPKLRGRDIFLLVVLKIAGQALISGTLFSYVFVFSAAGSLSSALVMFILYKLLYAGEHITDIGLSMAGALANNAAQLAAARFMIFGENTKYIAPVLLCIGFASGLLLGIFADRFAEKSAWYAGLPDWKRCCVTREASQPDVLPGSRSTPLRVYADLAAAAVLLPVFLLQKDTAVVWILAAAFCCMAAVKKHGKVKLLPSVFMTAGVTFFALLSPFGKVLCSIGSFNVTQGALLSGLHKSAVLCGMVYLSQFAVSAKMRFPGVPGQFIACMTSSFEVLASSRIAFRRGSIIAALDRHLAVCFDRARNMY